MSFLSAGRAGLGGRQKVRECLEHGGGAGLHLGSLRPRHLAQILKEGRGGLLAEIGGEGLVGDGDGGGGYQTGSDVGEEIVSGGESDDGLRVSPHLLGVHGGLQLQSGQQVVEVVQACAGTEVPLQLVQDEQLPLSDGLQADGEVRVHDELFTGYRGGLFEL